MTIEKKVLSDILVGIGNTMIMKAQPIIKSRPWKPVTVTSVDFSSSWGCRKCFVKSWGVKHLQPPEETAVRRVSSISWRSGELKQYMLQSSEDRHVGKWGWLLLHLGRKGMLLLSLVHVSKPHLSDGTFKDSIHGEGNGNPLQWSCLEKSMDRGVWWAKVHGITWLIVCARGWREMGW